MAPDGPELLTNRQSDQSTSASGPPEHVAQARTRKTVPPDRPAEDPSSIQSPTTKELNQRSPSASIVEFFNTIGAKRPLKKPNQFVHDDVPQRLISE
jgi:hypothetical protein